MKRHSVVASMLVAALPAAGVAAGRAQPQPASAEQRRSVDEASAHLARIDRDLKLTVAQAGAAREEKDVAKLVCVDEKLGAMRSLAKVAREANAELLSALAQGDAEAAGALGLKIATARARVEAVRGEAERCLGVLPYRADDTTTVEVREPAGLPGGDPTAPSLGVATRQRPPDEGSPLLGGDPQPRRAHEP